MIIFDNENNIFSLTYTVHEIGKDKITKEHNTSLSRDNKNSLHNDNVQNVNDVNDINELTVIETRVTKNRSFVN